MTPGQAVTEKTWFHGTALKAPVAGIITKLMDLVKRQIPVAYQDETGFHLGVQPAEKEPSWPPHW